MSSEWLSPGVVLSAVGLVGGAIAWLVTWSIRQDRRIESKASEKDLTAVKDEFASLERLFTATVSETNSASSIYQSRDNCNSFRTQQTRDVAELQRRIDVLTERIEALVSSSEDMRVLLNAVHDLVRVTNELRGELAAIKSRK